MVWKSKLGNKSCQKKERKIISTVMLTLLAVKSREGGAFQDLEIIFDFVGVPAEAVK